MPAKMINVNQLRQRQILLRIFIFTLVTVMIWVGFAVVRSQQSTQISADLQKLAEPLNPNIDQNALLFIQQKRSFSDAELQSFPINRLVTVNGEAAIVSGNTPISSAAATRP